MKPTIILTCNPNTFEPIISVVRGEEVLLQFNAELYTDIKLGLGERCMPDLDVCNEILTASGTKEKYSEELCSEIVDVLMEHIKNNK